MDAIISPEIAKKLPEGLILRLLEQSDYDKELLGQLTTVGKISRDKFNKTYTYLKNSPSSYICVVIEDSSEGKIVGTGTIFIEQKFIHDCANAGHIEDIVVSETQRGKGLGKLIIEQLTFAGKNLGCYKIILDCVQEKVDFYIKCGFKAKGAQMALYIESPTC